MSEKTTDGTAVAEAPAVVDAEIVDASPASDAGPELTPGQTTADVVGDVLSL